MHENRQQVVVNVPKGQRLVCASVQQAELPTLLDNLITAEEVRLLLFLSVRRQLVLVEDTRHQRERS